MEQALRVLLENGETTVTQPGRSDKIEQRCTAPHPVVPFLYFLATVLVSAAAIYWFVAE